MKFQKREPKRKALRKSESFNLTPKINHYNIQEQ